MRLDEIDAKLDRIEKQTHAAQPASKEEPAKASDSDVKTQTPKRAAAKKRVAKQTQPNKRTARKGWR